MVQGRARAFGMAAIFAGLLMIALPSTSLAAHDLRIKKQEKHFTLDSDELTVDISCDSGYRVVDGMWRIDHADQDDDLGYFENYVPSVDVLEAYSDTPTSYHFSFVKNAIGRVQGKVFITCIGINTEGDEGHTMAPTFFDGVAGAPRIGTPIPAGSTLLQSSTSNNGGQRCPAKSIVITPGFIVTPGSELQGIGRLVKSNLADITSGSDNRDWSWRFALGPAPGGAVATSFRCLQLKVNTLGTGSAPVGHKHKIIKKTRSSQPILAADSISNPQLHCGDLYKAAVAGFTIDDALVDGTLADYSFGLWHVWYMGMDPRPKTRAYRFFNQDNAASPAGGVILAATCLNYRTT
jgi:hypothetical protein